MAEESSWQNCSTSVFWAEVAPCNHLVQFYENDEIFIRTLSDFIKEGFNLGDCVVVIGTTEHLKALAESLESDNINMGNFINNYQYVSVNVDDALAKFMVNDWPDETLFYEFINDILKVPHQKGMQVRAFGEIVAVLWEKGNIGATVHLEQLWNEFCKSEAFCLFCAYPKSGFTEDLTNSMEKICSTHTKMINGNQTSGKGIEFAPIRSMSHL